MKLEITRPNLVGIEIMAWMVKVSLNANNLYLATTQLDELIYLIQEEERVNGEWKELLFSIVNKI